MRDTIATAAELLRQGKLVAFPTETVYGLGADARNAQAVTRIFQVKGRPVTHPLIVHLHHIDALAYWAKSIPPSAYTLAQHFWPGPLTLVLSRHASVPLEVTGGQDTIALRVPQHPMALALLETFGSGVAAPSANRYGRISPTSAAHVREELGDDVDYILDGGMCEVGIESTIVYLEEECAQILRPGHIQAAQIQNLLNIPVMTKEKSDIRVPGALATHYAPSAALYVLENSLLKQQLIEAAEAGRRIAVWSQEKPSFISPSCYWIQAPKTPELYAHLLYAQLRRFDALSVEAIYLEACPNTMEWAAVNDRLKRAATVL